MKLTRIKLLIGAAALLVVLFTVHPFAYGQAGGGPVQPSSPPVDLSARGGTGSLPNLIPPPGPLPPPPSGDRGTRTRPRPEVGSRSVRTTPPPPGG
jgi:hypothetical protein